MANGNVLLLSPVVARGEGYGDDTFTASGGLKPSFVYRSLDEARYDWKATLVGRFVPSGYHAEACGDVAEFIHRVAAVMRPIAVISDVATVAPCEFDADEAPWFRC